MIPFVLSFLLALAALLIPGFLICTAAGMGYRASVCVAAGPSLLLFFVVSIVLGMAHIDGLLPLAVGTAGVAVVVSAALLAIRAKVGWVPSVEQPSLWAIALYAAVGCALFAFLFLRNAGGFDWFLQFNDNSAHLTRIRAMVDGATTSPIRTMMYGSNVLSNQTPFDPASSGFSAPSSFYPVAYHNVAALVLATGVAPIAVVQNAVNAAFTAVVYPLGVCALISQITDGNGRAVLLGAVACGASYVFPLRALTIHQNYPNVAAFCCIPLVVALMVAACSVDDGAEKGERSVRFSLVPLALWLVSLLGIVDLHPNAAIVCAMVAGCFIMGRIVPAWARTLPRKATSVLMFVCAEAGVLLVCLSLWLICLVSPLFQSTVSFLWTWTVPTSDALGLVASLGLRVPVAQPLLAATVVIGLVWCVSHRGQGWVALVYGVLVAVFFANAVGTPTVKRIFAGFFYTDPDRTAALVGLWASIVAVFGLYAVVRSLVWVVRLVSEHVLGREGVPRAVPWVIAVVVCMLFSVGNYGEALAVDSYPVNNDHSYIDPSEDLPGGAFAWQEWELRWHADPYYSMFYRRCDADFMDRVVSITGADDLIVNIPLDGSMYAYPLDDANVLYKRELTDEDSATSREIRLRLDEYAENPDVQKAVEELGAKYVLQLSGKTAEGANYSDYAGNRSEDWVGISSITPETPGFELLLNDGPMNLYRIMPIDELDTHGTAQVIPFNRLEREAA